MLDKLHGWIKELNEIKHPAGIFESSLTIGTVLSLLFGLYQAIFGGDIFFGLVSAISVLVGTAGLLKWLGDGSVAYVTAYLVPAFLCLLATVFRIFHWIGVDPTPYYLNSWISAVSALLPPVAAVISSIVIPPVSCLLRWLERKLGAAHG